MILIFFKFSMNFYKNNQNAAILKIIKILSDRATFYKLLQRKVELKGVNASINIVHIRKLEKCLQNI